MFLIEIIPIANFILALGIDNLNFRFWGFNTGSALSHEISMVLSHTTIVGN